MSFASGIKCQTVQHKSSHAERGCCAAVQYSTVQHSTAQHSTVQHSTAKYSTAVPLKYSAEVARCRARVPGWALRQLIDMRSCVDALPDEVAATGYEKKSGN
eukprot:gene13393-biopygen1853